MTHTSDKYLAAQAVFAGRYAEARSMGLDPDAIADPDAAALVLACEDLFQAGRAISPELVRKRLKEHGAWIGEKAWSSITQHISVNGVSLADHVRDVMQAHRHAQHAEAAAEIAQVLRSDKTRPEAKEHEWNRYLECTLEREATRSRHVYTGGDLASRYRTVAARDEAETFHVRSGIPSFDDAFGGFVKGRLNVLGAYNNHGKTTTLRFCALSTALRYHRNDIPLRVQYNDLENGEDHNAVGCIATLAWLLHMEDEGGFAPHDHGVPIRKIIRTAYEKRGQYTRTEQKYVSAAQDLLAKLPITFDCTPGVSSLDVAARLRAEMRRDGADGVGLVVVDYAEVMRDKGDGRSDQVYNAVQGLHTLAQEHGVPVVLTAQLKRDYLERDGSTPRQSDLAWSSALEKIPAQVTLLHSEWQAWNQTGRATPVEPDRYGISLLVAKNKGDQGGLTRLKLISDRAAIYDPQDRYESAPF